MHVSSLLFAYASFALAVRHRHHLRAAVQGDQGQAPRLLLRAAAVAAGARRDELSGRSSIGWMFLTIGIVVGVVWAAQARALCAGRPARAGDVARGSEDLRRAADAGRSIRSRSSRPRRIGWGGRRAAYLSALGFAIVLLNFVPISYFLTHEPQLLNCTRASASWSASVIARRPSSCASGSISQSRGLGAARRGAGRRGRRPREAVVVSTCNRAEIYVACDDPARRASRSGRASSASSTASPPTAFAPHVYDLADLDAARHLFRVAAGLDSLVVGEPQILGQVKDASHGRGRARTAPGRC